MHKILIIDDEAMIRDILKTLFEQEGFKVILAEDGIKGMSLFLKDPVDLVITDIIMPEKEGLQTIRELNQKDPGLPIIAISGGGTLGAEQYLVAAEKFGARQVFQKPLALPELLSCVKKFLE